MRTEVGEETGGDSGSHQQPGISLLKSGARKLRANFFDGKYRRQMRNWVSACVALQVFFTLVSVVLAFVQIELARGSTNTQDEATVWLLIYISIACSAVTFVLIFIRYMAKYKSFAIRVSYNISFLRFLQVRGKLASFCFEILFVWILPYVPDPYISNWLIIFMFLRGLYPIPLLLNCISHITRRKEEITQNLKKFQQRSPKFGIPMTLRDWFKSYGELVTAVLYVALIVFFAYLFYSSSKLADLDSEEPRHYSYRVTVYWALITATTVGYGDILPVDTYQQALAITCTVLGVILSSLLMGFVTSKMNLAPNELLALRVAEQRELCKKRNNAAARVLQNMIRIANYPAELSANGERTSTRELELKSAMMRAIAELKDTELVLKNQYNFDPNARADTDSETLLQEADTIKTLYETLGEQINKCLKELDDTLAAISTKPEAAKTEPPPEQPKRATSRIEPRKALAKAEPKKDPAKIEPKKAPTASTGAKVTFKLP